MQLPAMATWAWIPIVICAALAQTLRNAAQRTLTADVGTLPATLVRFLYGLPFAALWLLLVLRFSGEGIATPPFDLRYFAWMSLGAISQLLATALLLQAMKEGNFIVAVAYSKTELLQVALFAALFLHELPGWISAIAMLIASTGVMILSRPKSSLPGGLKASHWMSKAALYGLGSGACFALALVGYRGASLALPGVSPWLIGAWGVLWAQALQTVLLGSYLAWRQPGSLAALARAWRLVNRGRRHGCAGVHWLAHRHRPAPGCRRAYPRPGRGAVRLPGVASAVQGKAQHIRPYRPDAGHDRPGRGLFATVELASHHAPPCPS